MEPPYLIRKSDGELDGFFVDLIKALAETENLKISFRVGGWEDLRQSIHRGRIDVVLGTPHPVPKDREPFSYLQVYNVDPGDFGGENPLSRPLRRVSGKDLGDLCFSVPVVEEPYSCMVKRDSDVKSLRDLKDQSVVVQSGSPALEFLSNGGLTSRMIAVASLEDAMRLVSSGIYPGSLMGTYQGLYLREQLGFKNLEYLMPPVFTLERGMVIAKGDAGLAMKLGRAFEGMRQTGAYRRLLSRWFGGYDTTIIDRDLAMKIGAVFVAVLFLIGGWNIILKREVARITREREKILDFTRDGIVAVDREGHVSMINKVAQDLLAVDEMVVGLWSEDVIPDVDFSTVLQTGEAVFDVEQNLRGSLVIANKAPVMYRGIVYGAIATFRDMTEIHALAEEITGVRMYVESLRVQNHEFQNKLQAIAGLIQMGRYEKAIEFITNEAKPASSSTSFVSENIKNPAVGGIVIGKVGRCRELGIDIRIDPDSFCNETEGISDQAMVVIIGNLLENGIEAVLASGVENPKLEFAIFDESNRIMISVVDNGGTMTDEIASRMFTKGFSTKTRSRPSGFGLYNVKKLVDAMEGDLSVDYVTGEYTEFMVTLPNGGI
nr:transporter substrate-binding domain-containing protein [uncultured Dethiosulfovibrio sp.]